jgi:penicillin-binding protein 1C
VQQRAKNLPPSTIISDVQALPATLKYFGEVSHEAQLIKRGPQIMFPPDGAKLGRELAEDGSLRPVVLKLEGGIAPYVVLVNGKPMPKHFRTRNIDVESGVTGYANFTVVDASGLVAAVNVFVE